MKYIYIIHWYQLKMKQTELSPTLQCTGCVQKDQILHKYSKLIKLYKKKQLKSSDDSQPQNSQINSKCLQTLSIQRQAINIIGTLDKIVRSRIRAPFDIYKQRQAKKLAILILTNITKKKTQQLGFHKIYQECLESTEQNQQKSLDNASIEIISGASQNHDYCFMSSIDKNNFSKEGMVKIQKRLSQKIGYSQNRKIMELEVMNKRLSGEVKCLNRQLFELNKRSEKDSLKKKESLQMLAEQLCEKSELINELQNSLKKYSNSYKDEQILMDDAIQLRAEVDHLQKVQDKLNHDIAGLRQQLQQNNLQILSQSQKIMELTKSNKQLEEDKFICQNQQKSYQQLNRDLTKIINFFSRKIKKLTIYQRQYEGTKDIIKGTQLTINQIKAQLILQYLANIGFEHYQLKCRELFDEEQQQFLKEHKLQYFKLREEADLFNKTHFLKEIPNNEDIKMKGISDFKTNCNSSMFSVIDCFQKNETKQCYSNSSGVNMKILELQLENRKHIQKISQLKQRIMYIRILIINCLKSFQLQQSNLKQESQGVIRVIFEMFEYSEQERQIMFPKKKKLFGFIG